MIMVITVNFVHTATASKKEWLACTSKINYWNTQKPAHFVLSYVLSVTLQ